MDNTQHTAFIILSGNCNKKCPYCFNDQINIKKRKDKITSKNSNSLVNNLAALKVMDAVLTGGEPLLKPDLLIRIVKELKRHSIKVSLDTNGTKFTKESIALLKQAGLGNVYLSSRYFLEIDEALVRRLKDNFNLKVIHVISGECLAKSEKLLKNISGHGIELIIQPAYIANNFKNFDDLSPLQLSLSEKREMFRIIKKYSTHPSGTYLKLLENIYINNIDLRPKSCHMGRNDLVVYSSGEVYPCFHRQDLECGNILCDPTPKIRKKLDYNFLKTSRAECFGEHCLSLFY